jgi:hypothetical protein
MCRISGGGKMVEGERRWVKNVQDKWWGQDGGGGEGGG